MQIGAKLSVLNENVYIHIWIPASHPAVTWALRHVLDYSVKLRGANIWDAKHKTDFFNSFLIFLLYVYSRTRGGPLGCLLGQNPAGAITDSKPQSSTGKCIFCYGQSNVWRLLPASNYCQARHYHQHWAQFRLQSEAERCHWTLDWQWQISAVNKFWSRHPNWKSRQQPIFQVPKARAS